MADRTYYCFCDSGCKFETLTKEQILTAITQAVNNGTIGNIDTGFITSVKTINGTPLKFFVGTQYEYEVLTAEEKQNLFAVITNDTTKDALFAAIEDLQNDINGIANGAIVAKKANEANTAKKADEAGLLVNSGAQFARKLIYEGEKKIPANNSAASIAKYGIANKLLVIDIDICATETYGNTHIARIRTNPFEVTYATYNGVAFNRSYQFDDGTNKIKFWASDANRLNFQFAERGDDAVYIIRAIYEEI